jgi:hypothetical protein
MVEVRPTNLSKEISTMTTATMALTELAEKGADIDVLRQMVQFMAQRLMELDVETQVTLGLHPGVFSTHLRRSTDKSAFRLFHEVAVESRERRCFTSGHGRTVSLLKV